MKRFLFAVGVIVGAGVVCFGRGRFVARWAGVKFYLGRIEQDIVGVRITWEEER